MTQIKKNTSHTSKHELLTQQLCTLLQQEKKRRDFEKSKYNWPTHARPAQLPPQGNWHTWLIIAGRGFGKTRTGAETIRGWVDAGLYKRIALLGDTKADVRHVMVEGESGLLSTHPPGEQPLWSPTKQQITWNNGAIASCYSADAAEHLRGPQFDAAWIDEFAKFHDCEKSWNLLSLALRLGKQPRTIITTTPKPLPILTKMLNDPSVIVTTGTTFDNAKNLSDAFIKHIQSQFNNTRLSEQEIMGKILDPFEQSLWSPELINRYRQQDHPPLERMVIAIDPAMSNSPDSAETGIIVAGLGEDGRGYVLEDLSLHGSPAEWSKVAVDAYNHYLADCIIAEVNNGGDLVGYALRSTDSLVNLKNVHAHRNKATRAQPIAALYEQGRISHIGSNLATLEHQLCTYIPHCTQQSSPDRLDALVWAITDLFQVTQQKISHAWSEEPYE